MSTQSSPRQSPPKTAWNQKITKSKSVLELSLEATYQFSAKSEHFFFWPIDGTASYVNPSSPQQSPANSLELRADFWYVTSRGSVEATLWVSEKSEVIEVMTSLTQPLLIY